MHTIMVIAGGIALLAVCLVAGRVLGGSPSAVAVAAKYFVGLWLLAAALNMWMGVSRAGYSVAEEAPIFVVVFSLPAALAAGVWWKYSH